MSETHAAADVTVRDPVCGMIVDPARTAHHATHDGRAFHFCCAGCRTRFEADPARYLSPPAPPAPEPAAAGAVYTCPMHPEVRQVGPGACPICGMALEPAAVTLDDAPNPELADMSRRFWIGLVLAAPLVALDMGGHLLGGAMPMGAGTRWLEFGAGDARRALGRLAVPAARLGVGGRRRHLNMFTLIGLGVAVAYVASLAALLAPGLFPAEARAARRAAALFRGRRRHRGAGAARPGAGAQGPRAHRRGDPRAAGAGAEDRAARDRRTRR